MPITQSAKKALRQNVSRRERNSEKKALMKRTIKSYRKLVLAKKMDEAKKILPRVYKVLDKLAKANVIKKNNASRLKSRLTQLINKSTRASS